MVAQSVGLRGDSLVLSEPDCGQGKAVEGKREPQQMRKPLLGQVAAELQAARNSRPARQWASVMQGERPELTPPTLEAMKQAMSYEDQPGAPRSGPESINGMPFGDAGAIDKTLTGSVRWRLLMNLLDEKLGAAAAEELKSETKRFTETKQSEQKSLQKRSEELQAKEEAARKAQEVMGCLGKIIGGAIAAISIGSALITGGASLVLAGIALGVMAADAITEELTGESLTGRLLNPIMEKVFSPMAKLIGNAIADVLKKIGVNSDLADTIGAIAGAVAAAIAIVAAAVVAKSLPIGKAIQSMSRPLIKSMGKMMPKLISGAGSKLSSALASGAGKVSSSVSQAATKLGGKVGITNAKVAALQASRFAVVAGGVDAVGQAGVTGWVGLTNYQNAQIEAEMTLVLAQSPIMNRMLETSVEHWQATMQMLGNVANQLTDRIQSEQEVSLRILANTRKTARGL